MRDSQAVIIQGKAAISGSAHGKLLVSHVELSFWGGVDPWTGKIVDSHHDLVGHTFAGKILAIPSGRGSCASSGVIMELLLSGRGPAALILQRPDDILAFGAIVSEEVFGKSIPIVIIGEDEYARLQTGSRATVNGGRIEVGGEPSDRSRTTGAISSVQDREPQDLRLSRQDQSYLDGQHGKAAQVAMRIILRMARLQNAEHLFSISRVHIDGCVYTGPASLKFAEQFRDWGGKVAIPTTLNAISVDKQHWRSQGVAVAFGEPAERLGDAYVAMGAQPTFTCAPYLLDDPPVAGEQIGWAESNAVVFANSILSARTMKYPDYLDACIALVGRAPFVGCHTDDGRRPELLVKMAFPSRIDDSFYPLLGYQVGKLAGNRIPFVLGLEGLAPTLDNLKAFSAAFATTSSAPMFHIGGITPEASGFASMLPDLECQTIGADELLQVWDTLNSTDHCGVDLVSFGNPHFSLGEFETLASLCRDRKKNPSVEMIITSGRNVYQKALDTGAVEILRDFGARFMVDTCWCQIEEPVIPRSSSTIMTNSAKYAHYGPGLTTKNFRFGSFADCVEAACNGSAPKGPPLWLSEGSRNGACP